METTVQLNEQGAAILERTRVEGIFIERYRSNIEHSSEYWAFEIDDDRLLTEMAHLRLAREKEGAYESEAIADIKQNYVTAIYERAIPNGVSKFTYNRWLGKTPETVAASGYDWHNSIAAYRRVDIEVEAARSIDQELQLGFAKVIISPKMSSTDASATVAKRENLDKYDSIQVYYSTENGIEAEAILVEDVSLSSWYNMLNDQNSLVKSDHTLNSANNSALDIMSTHSSLVVPIESLERGSLSVLEEVINHEKDVESYTKLRKQLESFNTDQEILRQQAQIMAEEWLRFDIQLEESLNETGVIAGEVADFIDDQRPKLDKPTQEFIEAHRTPEGYVATPKLAALAEDMKRNTVWARTGVRVNNREITKQIQPEKLERLAQHEQAYDSLISMNMNAELQEMSRRTDSMVASMNIDTGDRGCPTGGGSRFAGNALNSEGILGLSNQSGQEDQYCPEVKNGQKGKCPSCKKVVSIIVKDKLYCSRGECSLAHPSIKKKNTNQARGKSKKGASLFDMFELKKKELKTDKLAA